MENGQEKQQMIVGRHRLRAACVCRYGNTIILLFIAVYFFFIPFCLSTYYIADPGLKGAGVPWFAVNVHKALSPRYEAWARGRVAGGAAKYLSTGEIAPTEWPVFGSVFYLWATEALQQGWEKDKSISKVAPNVYAAGAIEAAAALVADPNHAAWVKEHWGQDYLHKENVFYRMLLISGLTSYHKLLGGDKYIPIVRDQVDTLSAELDQSPYGLLDDYPGQCFPMDVAAAIAAIKRADSLLVTDHNEFVSRSIRAFEGKLHDWTGLPPYMADARHGTIDMARGCSNQWGITWAAELWPETAGKWYGNFDKHFWQRRWGAVGFREFEKNVGGLNWYMDVDSGPVLAGFGASACALGVGTARASNRFDQAYTLGAEVIVTSWPLLDGTLLTARMLSNATHAKYVGEACLLFSFTRPPLLKRQTYGDWRFPPAVYYILTFYLIAGVVLVMLALRTIRWWRIRVSKEPIRFGKIQLVLWAALVCVGIAAYQLNDVFVGLLLVLLAQLLPRGEKIIPVRQLVESP